MFSPFGTWLDVPQNTTLATGSSGVKALQVKILVPVKRVIDPCVAVRVKADGTGMETSGVRMSMNPFDEIAVEAAVRLREAGIASEVVVVSCGVSSCQETLRTALAMGADRGVLVSSDAELFPLSVARLLEALCLREQPTLVICGKQAVDDDASQVGPMLAALLGWPQATFVSAMAFVEGKAQVMRRVDGGSELVELTLPGVLTCELGLNEPRYATLPNIMKARKKPLLVLTPAELGVEIVSRLTLLDFAEPPKRKPGVRVADAGELIRMLRAETGVLEERGA
jgi:electron transfer flavoprotein beta subunit